MGSLNYYCIEKFGLLKVSGNDASKYLQTQLSQDIGSIEIGGRKLSLVLEPEGYVHSVCGVTKVKDQLFLIDIESAQAEALLARLKRFLLRSEVAFELDFRDFIFFCSKETKPGLKPEDGIFQFEAFPGINLCYAASSEKSNYLKSFFLDGTWRQAANPELIRIKKAIPRHKKEITGNLIAHEIPKLIEVSVSFSKGCYCGQELVERISARGARVPKEMVRVKAAKLNEGERLFNDKGDEIGEITSRAQDFNGDFYGLGFVKRKYLDDGVGKTNSGLVEIRRIR